MRYHFELKIQCILELHSALLNLMKLEIEFRRLSQNWFKRDEELEWELVSLLKEYISSLVDSFICCCREILLFAISRIPH